MPEISSKRLLIVVAGVFLLGCAYGVLTHRYHLPPWGLLQTMRSLVSGSEEGKPPRVRTDPDRARALRALGYVSETAAMAGPSGVVIHDRGKALDGLNLYCSDYGSEAILIDMEGEVVHRWRIDTRKVWPDFDRRTNLPGVGWRKVWLYPDGDLLAINAGVGVVRLDRDSTVKWKVPGLAHHDIYVDQQGKIHTLMREIEVLPRIHPEEEVIDDVIVTLGADGEEENRISILQAFERSTYAPVLEHMAPSGDLMHTNALKVIEQEPRDPESPFKPGRFLISSRVLDTIALVDPDTERVEWALTGLWIGQHEPVLLENGNLLVFDNRVDGYSRVLEIDPLTQQVEWTYEGDEENAFVPGCCGSNRRLENGNTLITHSVMGRVFEVTPSGEIVWEFRSPHRVPRDGQDRIPYIFEMTRWPAEQLDSWLPRADP